MCIVISHLGETSNVTNECEISYARIPLVDEGAGDLLRLTSKLASWFPGGVKLFQAAASHR